MLVENRDKFDSNRMEEVFYLMMLMIDHRIGGT